MNKDIDLQPKGYTRKYFNKPKQEDPEPPEDSPVAEPEETEESKQSEDDWLNDKRIPGSKLDHYIFHNKEEFNHFVRSNYQDLCKEKDLDMSYADKLSERDAKLSKYGTRYPGGCNLSWLTFEDVGEKGNKEFCVFDDFKTYFECNLEYLQMRG
jgi:hypothetical protein